MFLTAGFVLVLLLLPPRTTALYQLRSIVTRQVDEGFCFGPTWRRAPPDDEAGAAGRRAFSFSRVIFAAAQHNGSAELLARATAPSGANTARLSIRCTTGTSLTPPSAAEASFDNRGVLDAKAGNVDRPQGGRLITEVGYEWSDSDSGFVVRPGAVEGDWQCRVCNVGVLGANVTYTVHYVHDYVAHAAAAARQPAPGREDGSPDGEGGGLQNGGHSPGNIWVDGMPPGRWLDLQLPTDSSADGSLGREGGGRAWTHARVALDNRSGAGVELHAYSAAAWNIRDLVPPSAVGRRTDNRSDERRLVARVGETLELLPGALFSVYNGGAETARLRVLTWTVPVSAAARAAAAGSAQLLALTAALGVLLHSSA